MSEFEAPEPGQMLPWFKREDDPEGSHDLFLMTECTNGEQCCHWRTQDKDLEALGWVKREELDRVQGLLGDIAQAVEDHQYQKCILGEQIAMMLQRSNQSQQEKEKNEAKQ